MTVQTQNKQELVPLLTIQDLANLLKISPRSIWRLVATQKLVPPIHVGGAIRWKQESITKWLDNGGSALNVKTDGNCDSFVTHSMQKDGNQDANG